jgi:pimeloyl-ACP methyl ester carboxylesterase
MSSPDTPNPFNYIQQGTGAPVILIHGLAASLFDWNDLLPELAASGYAAYAVDLLGHGQSHKPELLHEYTVENVQAHFSDWLDSLQLTQPLILVGHSLGGYIAIHYALSYPERVRALVLADPLFSLDQLPLILRLYYQRPPVSATFIQNAPDWLIRGVVDLTSLSIRNGHVLPKEVRIQTAADYKRAHPGIFNILHSFKNLTLFLPSVSQPTLLLWGENDQTLAPALFPKLLNVLPQAKGYGIPGAGHVPHQSHPKEFNQRVMAFLQTLKS